MNKEVETALTRARIHLVMNQPFFGTLALYLHMQEGKVPTIGTDGTNLYYNPEFIEQFWSLKKIPHSRVSNLYWLSLHHRWSLLL
jgi:predicted metal-dependent peptidase